MNSITNVILITTHNDGAKQDRKQPNIYCLNEYLMKQGYLPALAKVDCHAGGNKPMASDVWIGAFDQFDIEAFKDVFESIEWENPESLQLMIRGPKEHQFQVFELESPVSTR